MPRNGTKNLIPQSERTKDEQKKIAKKGGIKSGEVRRERKKLKDELLLLLSQGDTQSKMCLAIINQATEGNTKAFEIIRDTIGEKPVDNTEMENSNGILPELLDYLKQPKNTDKP